MRLVPGSGCFAYQGAFQMSTATKSIVSHADALEPLDPAWRDLYRIAGWAALLTAIFIPIQIAVFMIWPPPPFEPTVDNALRWIEFFNANPLLALLDLDLLIIVDVVLGVPVTLALYASLRRADHALALVGAAFGLIATVAYFAANPTISMLTLSLQYAASATDVQRGVILIAGQVLMMNYQGTAFHLFYILGAVSPLLFALAMLRGNLFGRWIPWISITANVVAFGLYIPAIGIYVSVFSVLILWVYTALLARRFLTA
jgi:hypothetical protein